MKRTPTVHSLVIIIKASREKLWKRVEAHVIYALVYTMCMSLKGVEQLKKYFSAKDQQVFEPLFIAQYLLTPVNTIVKNSLGPWMMKAIGLPKENLLDKDRARKIKA